MSVSLTFRCPDDLAALIASQVEATGQDKTSVVVKMLRSSLPSLPLVEKNKLPDIAAIYIVWSSNNLLYIGKTRNLKQRFGSHHRIVDFLATGDNVWIAWFPSDSQDSPLLEGSLIELLEPELNSNVPGRVTKVCFRLPDEVVQVIETLQLEGETLNQTAQRFLIENLRASSKQPQPLPITVDVQELVKQEVAASLGEVRSQLDELRGGSFSRSTAVSTKSPDVDILEVFKQEVAASLGEVRSQLEELRGKLKAR